jgi:hypothetical protein
VLRAGLIGGLVGGVTIWMYEAVVWVGVQHLMPLVEYRAMLQAGFRQRRSSVARFAGLCCRNFHSFLFRRGMGRTFCVYLAYFRRRGFEATFVALPYAMFAWIVMHVAIMVASDNHPNYYDPNVIIGGFMSHFFFAVPMALYVKHRMWMRTLGK